MLVTAGFALASGADAVYRALTDRDGGPAVNLDPPCADSPGLAYALYDWWTGEEARIAKQVREQEWRVREARREREMRADCAYLPSFRSQRQADEAMALLIAGLDVLP